MDSESQSSTGRMRGKTDPAWEHFTESRSSDGKNSYTCVYCHQTYRGGGINRMKYHISGKIAGKQSGISACKSVPYDVRVQMEEHLKSFAEKKNQDKANIDAMYSDEVPSQHEVDEIQELPPTKKARKKESTNKAGKMDNYFAERTTPGAQPGIRSVFATKEIVHKADMALARWFYDACIPFNAAQSPYFQQAVDAMLAIGPGYKVPSYNALRVNLLGDCKRECALLIESYRKIWANYGCTIMADGWTDQRQRTLINFLVYCHDGISFVKSIDASDVVKDRHLLCDLFSEIVEWVGPSNVVHLVTDNAANYKAAGELLKQKYRSIYWSPCAAHCLNLTLKDIGSLPHVVNLTSRASKLSIFVYNHIAILAWLRKRSGWKEIVRPAMTRFATTFITLKSIHDHKHDLQALVIDKFFIEHKLSKTVKGRQFSSIILDSKFWNDCLMMVKIAGPIIRLLRVVDSDEKPSLAYVYDGMARIEKAIKAMFQEKERLYKPYIEIIDKRWDKHLRQHIHAAAYFLNPTFAYGDDFEETLNVMTGVLDLLKIRDTCLESVDAMKEIRLYRDRHESFSWPSTLTTAKSLQPS